jgi:hypothetical protein
MEKMMIAYVFTHEDRIAVTDRLDGSNLPNLGKGVGIEWRPLRRVDDVNECGVMGFDRSLFDRQGYQVLPRLGSLVGGRQGAALNTHEVLSDPAGNGEPPGGL